MKDKSLITIIIVLLVGSMLVYSLFIINSEPIIYSSVGNSCPSFQDLISYANQWITQSQCTGLPVATGDKIYVYLATTEGAGWTQAQLDGFANNLKDYMYTASYGALDMEFITEINADQSNPNIDHSLIGNQIKGIYYLSKTYPTESINWINSQNFNANINWLFSSAAYHAPMPNGWTTLVGTYTSGCNEIIDANTIHDLCKESAHELGHTLFACLDNSGDIMRPTTQYPYTGHYPPDCIDKINYYIPQLTTYQ